VGLGLLALTVLRLAVRRLAPPAGEGELGRFEALASRATHGLLYAILLAMPLSGLLASFASGHPVDLFGVLTIPSPLAKSEMLTGVAFTVHSTGQLAVYGVVGLHVAAALFHLLVRRDGVMARMWPGARLTPALAAARPGVR
jgi:cytochrome b561